MIKEKTKRCAEAQNGKISNRKEVELLSTAGGVDIWVGEVAIAISEYSTVHQKYGMQSPGGFR